ncbi:metal-dependent transcriptional regulator [Mycetocola reblochoni]|uniref:Manganese transport regulator n=2 Tax=Mycetocola reblochoni TaxID=331618 RepID=A0A1R4INR6_9MICO|nr:metal-dependent transcriptional regulator [Mycetocola reblochoni]RLP67881.1 metal-dependent transcriptional regulator [Mycetocola reblochoni]SJN21530.1 Mn-dependent transcriptional regulator MntR [Mycetocola reblochoni REB411]
MSSLRASRVVEDYLARIWKNEEWGDTTTTAGLASSVGVTPSTVSATLKKLARDGHIDYAPYGSVTLTDAGRRIAVQVVRRHRILEAYLVDALGLGWHEVHQEADALEHAVSEAVLERMMDVLGQPDRDPHGDPIPDSSGRVEAPRPRRLSILGVGESGVVDRVSDRQPELLPYLHDRGLVRGTRVEVVWRSDATGLLGVRRVVALPVADPALAAVEVAGGAPYDIPLAVATAVGVCQP